MNKLLKITIFFYIVEYVVAQYSVKITTSAPVIAGGVVHFRAELFYYDKPASGTYLYESQDNSLSGHFNKAKLSGPYEWFVNYTDNSPPGKYVMQVVVYDYMLFVPYRIITARKSFHLTSTFNGNLTILQNNKSIETLYVSNATPLLHEVKLKDSDMEYLNNTATEILTYWFVDCVYYGVTNNLKFVKNYTKLNEEHVIEVFVVPNFEPLPTEPPTTTSTTTTTTESPNTTTTTKPPKTNKPDRRKRELDLITNFNPRNPQDIVFKVPNKQMINGTVKYNNSFPFLCENHTIVPMLYNAPYGYFSRKIVVKEPVNKIIVSGNNWIQRSEVLDLLVTCNGSSNFRYCYMLKNGIYNVTGNETCHHASIDTSICEFRISHYFYDNNVRTAVIIISNDVNTQVYGVTINIYKVNKQAQLSVVVVPVGFSLVAIVLIIFGVAYYVQNRSRYIIEVADFNFGEQYPDLEYKTFTERLKDSFTHAFTRDPIPSGSSEGYPVWHTGDNKYNSIS